MGKIKFQGISSEDIDIEGAVIGVGRYYIEGNSASFTIESKSENKILEIKVGKKPFWNFCMGSYKNQLMKNPNWKKVRGMLPGPPPTEILEIEVPEDAIIEMVVNS